jgi:hypothetical protein
VWYLPTDVLRLIFEPFLHLHACLEWIRVSLLCWKYPSSNRLSMLLKSFKFVQSIVLFVSDTRWLKCAIAWLVCELCMPVCLLCYFTYVTTCMLVWGKVVCGCFIWKTLVYNRIDLITKFFKTLICSLNLFVSDTPCLCGVEWMKCLWLLYACILIACFYFSDDRFERRVCGGKGGLGVSRERRSGTSKSRQAIYLLHIWILICHYALLYSCFY